MSPRQKYYGSMLVGLILGLLTAASSGTARILFVTLLLADAAHMVFIRCPKCRKRLSSMDDVPGVHGLPDAHCDNCGAAI